MMDSLNIAKMAQAVKDKELKENSEKVNTVLSENEINSLLFWFKKFEFLILLSD